MRAIETIATATPDGKLIASVPVDIPPGQHQVVLVIAEAPTKATERPPLDWPVTSVEDWPSDFVVRREDLTDA